MKLNLFAKGTILLAIPIVGQFIFLLLAFQVQRERTEAERLFEHTKEVLEETSRAFALISESSSGLRGFAATRDPEFAAAQRRAVASLPANLDSLETLVSDNPEQLSRARAIRAEADELLAWQSQALADLQAGDIARVRERMRKHEGLTRQETLRRQLLELQREEERLDKERTDRLERNHTAMSRLLIGGGIASALLMVVLALLIRRSLLGRFQTLMENTRRLAASKPLTPPLAGSDEIALLDRAFREMAAALENTSRELRESSQRFQDLYDEAPCGYHSVDPSGIIIAMNRTELRWLGYEAKELIGQKTFVHMLADSSRDAYWATFEKVKATGGAADIELDLVRRDGSSFTVLLNSSSILDGAGRYLRSRSTLTDISDRKRAEMEVRRLNADLERRVQERTVELAEANRDLSQKNEENEMFVYSVSHDLRSPLVNLQGFSAELGKSCTTLAELLADPAIPPELRDKGMSVLDGKATKSLGFIRAAVSRLSTIIDALLRLSRAGRIEYRWERVDLARIVKQILDAMQNAIAQKNASVAVGELPPAWGDATALEQLFANLIGNALVYLDPARPGRIEIGFDAYGPAGEGPAYFVRDNGLGIAEDHRGKIFQVFQRAHPGVGSGEGIGLSIVARVAERHRGRVWVASKVGEGSTFFVALRSGQEVR
ncbi:MAG TPA: ATP-binding protein [Urbifossiella sp.]|nr:ATP-binding protein [Urbifossiella sp.]